MADPSLDTMGHPCERSRELVPLVAAFGWHALNQLQKVTRWRTGGGPTRLETKVILSSHDFEGTPDDAALRCAVAPPPPATCLQMGCGAVRAWSIMP